MHQAILLRIKNSIFRIFIFSKQDKFTTFQEPVEQPLLGFRIAEEKITNRLTVDRSDGALGAFLQRIHSFDSIVGLVLVHDNIALFK